MATCLACHVPFHGECCERCPTIGCAESPRHLPFTVRAPKSCSCFFGRPCSRCRARWAAQAEARREELIGTAIKWFVIAVLVGVVAYAVL